VGTSLVVHLPILASLFVYFRVRIIKTTKMSPEYPSTKIDGVMDGAIGRTI
jgi:hypothetical protein